MQSKNNIIIKTKHKSFDSHLLIEWMFVVVGRYGDGIRILRLDEEESLHFHSRFDWHPVTEPILDLGLDKDLSVMKIIIKLNAKQIWPQLWTNLCELDNSFSNKLLILFVQNSGQFILFFFSRTYSGLTQCQKLNLDQLKIWIIDNQLNFQFVFLFQ